MSGDPLVEEVHKLQDLGVPAVLLFAVLDESRKEAVPGARRDLFEAMKLVAETGNGPEEQIPSMGCSIKWIGESE